MSRRKPVHRYTEYSVTEAIEGALSDAEELKEELQAWLDNMPQNLQGGSKAEEIQAAIDELENVNEPAIPESASDLRFEYTWTQNLRASRRDRLDDCVARIEQAKEVAAGKAEELLTEYEDSEIGEVDEKLTEGASELEELVSELNDIIDIWNGVEFPGMR